jgi:hypothetical protein
MKIKYLESLSRGICQFENRLSVWFCVEFKSAAACCQLMAREAQ